VGAAGWGSPEVYGPLAAGTALLTAFLVTERMVPSPMLPAHLLRNRPFVSANAAGFLLTAAMMSGVVFFVQYLQAARGEGPLAAGTRLLPLTASLFVVAPLAGRLVARLGERRITAAGLLCLAAGQGWMALGLGGSYPALIPAMIVAGVGASAVMPAAQHAAIAAAGRESIGTASGVYNAMRQVGGAFGIAIASAVFTAAGSFASPAAVTRGTRAALLVTAGIAVLGALASTGLSAPAERAASVPARPGAAAGDAQPPLSGPAASAQPRPDAAAGSARPARPAGPAGLA
jgi:Na+/melibiose symporter-like transporter